MHRRRSKAVVATFFVLASFGAAAVLEAAFAADTPSGARPASGGVSVTPATVPPGPPTARPHFVHTVKKGFFDDPIALHATQPLLAVIHTDSASFLDVQIIDVEERKLLGTLALGNPQAIYEGLIFAGQDKSILVATRDPASGKRTVQRYDDKGKPAGLVGPVSDFGVSERGDKHYLIAWDRSTDRKGETVFSVTAYDLATLVRAGKPQVLRLGEGGMLRKPAIKLLGWLDGYSQAIGQEVGGYDEKKDMRVPDRAARYDLLRGEIVWRSEIEDVRGWATINGMRARDTNLWAYLEPAEDLESLTMVDGLGFRATVDLAIPFDIYDPRSLDYREQAAAAGVDFTLAVDPLNSRALLRKKADQPKLDLYRLDVPDPGALATQTQKAATHVIRTALDDRPVQWATRAHWLAVLRKFKAFSRGGDSLEVYRLP